jgi:aarF domain-containing kinase
MQFRGYATRSRGVGRQGKQRRVILAATTGGALGAAAVTFADDVKHGYEAAERTGRVVSTLFVNINEYDPCNLAQLTMKL